MPSKGNVLVLGALLDHLDYIWKLLSKFFHWVFLLMVSFVFSLQLKVEATKFFNNTIMDLGVSIIDGVEVQSLEDFISH